MWQTDFSSMQFSRSDRATVRESLAEAEQTLAGGPHPERARRDAETLLLHALQREDTGVNRAWLIAHGNDLLAPEAAVAFRALLNRRAAGEPVQYITGATEFYRLPFAVNRDVLIPRPETELLVEKVLEMAPLARRPRIADVGTGSGAIAVALAHEWPDAAVTAIDLSDAALNVARNNAERAGCADRIRFLRGDLLGPVAGEQFEVVISNPPYVPEQDRATLDVEVREYEPAQALFAGADGLDVYRRLIPAAFAALVPGGHAVFEIGYGQQEPVRALLDAAGFHEIAFVPDLQGIARVASGRRPVLLRSL